MDARKRGPVGVIGLGKMGLPMAQRLEAAGHRVLGYDLCPERRARLAGAAESLEALCAECPVLLLSLPSSREVEIVVRGPVRAHARPGCLVIDSTTADPRSTRALQAELAAAGIGLVDAPVSGGAAGAEAGQLLVMVGGLEADVARGRPLLEPLARAIVVCGGPGSGNVAKLINNLQCAAHLALAGEALALADRAGIEVEALLQALNQGSGRSAVTEVNLPRWVFSGRYDSGFTMALMRKDVALAEALGGLGPVARAAAARWAESAGALDDGEDFNRMVDWVRRGTGP